MVLGPCGQAMDALAWNDFAANPAFKAAVFHHLEGLLAALRWDHQDVADPEIEGVPLIAFWYRSKLL